MRNYWTALEDTSFAEWIIEFPPPRTIVEMELIQVFANNLIKAGEEHAVYRITLENSKLAFPVDEAIEFPLFWNKVMETEGVLPLFDLSNDGNYRRINVTSGNICFYDRTSKVRTLEVSNMKLLAEELFEESDSNGELFVEDVGPVTITSRSVSKKEILENGNHSRFPVQISISLNTDIWFPRVMGFMTKLPTSDLKAPEWYDNRELALCHTPRLNQFIRDAQRFALKVGAHWKPVPAIDIGERYRAMVSENGIVL